jgi:hypothetical protein
VKAFGCCRGEQNGEVNDDILFIDEIVSESAGTERSFGPACSE